MMELKMKTINQLEVGEVFQGFFIVKSAEAKFTTNNSKYLDVVLSDKTGEINGKIWDCTEEHEKICCVNTVIKIQAEVSKWKERLQITIRKIRTLTENDGVKLEDLVKAAPYSAQSMYEEVQLYITKMDDQEIQRLVRTIIDSQKEKLMYFPAAQKNHHAIKSGLLYHILNMLRTGEKICQIYPFLNRDLVFAGVILHDIAKLDELDANELGIVSDYTKEGHLLGHIIQGIKLIDFTARKLGVNEEKSLLLQHMILAHHNEPEFGSPVRPMFPEAEVLHFLDLLDAKLYTMNNALEDVEREKFTDRIWSLNNRKIYKHSL
jgi:3'-5' exoribonuclease